MAPKTRVRKKAVAAALASSDIQKKQLVSFFPVESIPTGDETGPSSIASPVVNETETTAAMDIESVLIWVYYSWDLFDVSSSTESLWELFEAGVKL